MALGSTQPLVKMSTRNIPGGKGGRCVRLTTSLPSRAECHEIWESKAPGTLWACYGNPLPLPSYKITAILVRFKYTLYVVDRFSKNAHLSDFIKICPLGAEVFHEDGRTDMTKVTEAFRNFANTPKNDSSRTYTVSNWKTNWIYVASNHKIQNNFRNRFKTKSH